MIILRYVWDTMWSPTGNITDGLSKRVFNFVAMWIKFWTWDTPSNPSFMYHFSNLKIVIEVLAQAPISSYQPIAYTYLQLLIAAGPFCFIGLRIDRLCHIGFSDYNDHIWLLKNTVDYRWLLLLLLFIPLLQIAVRLTYPYLILVFRVLRNQHGTHPIIFAYTTERCSFFYTMYGIIYCPLNLTQPFM